MRVRFYNVRILTMRENEPIFTGELHVDGSRIVYVGEPLKQAGTFDREIDGKGNLLLPGFKNAHTHSAMTFARSLADDLPLQEWLTTRIFPMEARLTPDQIYHLSKLAILEYLTSGVTANFDMYLTPETIAAASADLGFRTVMVGGLNNFSQSLAQMEDWYETYNRDHELIRFELGFHAEYTTSRELLEGVAALARKYRAPVFMHNSETESEVAECIGRYGLTPTKLFDELGIFDYGGGGYHCVYLNEEDLDIFARRGLSVVTNPGSNTKLASGIAPISRMLEKGINVAIGTDGPSSNNCLDMFREMFLTTGLAKLRERDAAAVDADAVLRMATVGGAKAMGLSDCDVLAEGKLADLILIDLHQPNMQPLNNLSKNLVYSGSKQNVKLTMVNGKILYENGEFFVGEDPEEIYAKANEIVGEIAG
jgi:5-methylthioadenosine/S-adenosylhomocysteine deaminase